ncbi:MAG: hypothetical protein A2Y33_07410 [Spirochaetes bacterium GWF1_51_8]|nr:MAG: hypothetical protein A2Y33_07410 [Spirochaetes bacterium GWF1_51_8]
MRQLLEGVYHQGHIDIDSPVDLKENTRVKVLIVTDAEEKTEAELGVYDFGKKLDKVNIRDFAHED